MQRLAVVAALSLTLGCTFDSAVEPGAVIACGEAQTCPPGFRCSVELGRCLSQDNPDREAPRLLSSSLSGSVFRRGDVLRAQLVASERLGVPPAASVVVEGVAQPLVFLGVSDDETPTASFELTVGNQAETSAVVVVDLVDVAGNVTRSIPLGSVRFDFTPPSISRVAFVTPRQGDGGVLELRTDERLSLNFAFSEEVMPSATLRGVPLGCDDAGVVPFTLLTATEATMDFSAEAPAGVSGCSYRFELEGVEDRAGNPRSAEPVEARYAVLGLGPAISGLRTVRTVDGGLLDAPVVSQQPGFRELGLSFTAAPSTVALAAQLDGEDLGCSLADCAPASGGFRCFCPRTVTRDDGEGLHVFVVSARDGAGNARTATVPIRFDFTPPRLVPGTTVLNITAPPTSPLSTVSAVGLQGRVQVAFSVDELVEGAPTLVSAPATLSFALRSSTMTSFVFAATASGTLAQGVQELTATVADSVGNTNAFTLRDAAFTLDTVAPDGAPTQPDAGITFVRAPWGLDGGPAAFFVTIPPGVLPPGVLVRVFDGPTPATAIELGRATSSLDAGLTVPLLRNSQSAVYLTLVDTAGNESPARDVKVVEWHATMKGKIANSPTENPHRFEARPSFSGALNQRDFAERTDDAQAVSSLGGANRSRSTTWRWSQRGVQDVPSSRTEAGWAYDSLRHRLVQFGGFSGTTPLAETWEFDGAQWERIDPLDKEGDGNPPGGRGALAFDSKRGRVVKLGAVTADGGLGGVWEWDGVSWIKRSWVGRSPGREALNAQLLYASDQGSTLAYQTTGAAADLLRVFEGWDGEKWTRTELPIGPGFAGAVGYDPDRRCVVNFGGLDVMGRTVTATWCGGPWQTVQAPAPPVSIPGAFSSDATMAYDRLAQRLLMIDNVTLRPVWEWSFPGWTERNSSTPLRTGVGQALYVEDMMLVQVLNGAVARSRPGPWENVPVARLPARGESVLAFDSARGAITRLSYESPGPAVLEDLDGGAWVAPLLGPAAPINARFLGATFASSRWTSFFESSSPPPTTILAAGPGGGNLPVSGSASGGGVFSAGSNQATWLYLPNLTVPATYSYDGTWRFFDAGVPRPEVLSPALGFDSQRKVAVMFGGRRSNAAIDETWVSDGGAWFKVVPSDPEFDGNPSARADGRLVFAASRQGLVLFGGTGAVTNSEVWVWNGSSWNNETPLGPAPEGRASPGLTYDPNADALFMVGGSAGLTDTWVLATVPGDRPAHVFRVDFSEAGAESNSTVDAITVLWRAGGRGGLSSDPLGVELLSYERNSFTPVLTSPLEAVTPMEWTTTDRAQLARLLSAPRRELVFAVRTRGGARREGPATITTDYVEAVVRYVRP